MKRLWILLLAVGVVLALAVPVAATPGDDIWCADRPDHALCVGDPEPDEPDPSYAMPCGGELVAGVSNLTVDLGGRKSGLPSGACIDVMSDTGPWTVTVDVLQGTLRSMSVFIRDSVAPGDGCFPGGSCGIGLRDIPTENPFTLTTGMEDIPEAYVNACNVFPDDNFFGEWAFDKLGEWTFFEGIRGDLPSPLAFMPSISGSNDLQLTLTVTFPEYTGPEYTG